MKKIIFFLLCFLFVSFSLSAIVCDDTFLFCEVITENSNVVKGTIINKSVRLNDFSEKSVLDVVVEEIIFGSLTVDTISIINGLVTSELSHDSFNIGDEIIINNIEENRIDDITGRPFISPNACVSRVLTLKDGIVRGSIQRRNDSQSIEDFKAEIEGCVLTSIDPAINGRIIISPNPSADEIRIYTTIFLDDNFSYELFNSAGQIILSGLFSPSTNNALDINTLSNGVYFLRIQIRDQVAIKKVIKI